MSRQGYNGGIRVSGLYSSPANKSQCATPGCTKSAKSGFKHCSRQCAITKICATQGCNKPANDRFKHCSRQCATTPVVQTCVTPGCVKPANPGHQHCSRQCATAPVVQICATSGCGRPVHPGHPYCGKSCAMSNSSSQNSSSATSSGNGSAFVDFYESGKWSYFLTNLYQGPDGGFVDNRGIPELGIPATGLSFPTAEHYFQFMKFYVGHNGSSFYAKPLGHQLMGIYNSLCKLQGRQIQLFDKQNPTLQSHQVGKMWGPWSGNSSKTVHHLNLSKHSSKAGTRGMDYNNLYL